MLKFNATIEFIQGQAAAILSIFSISGEWVCGGRIETDCHWGYCGHDPKESLYEIGYNQASLTVKAKGGRLETYRVVQ